jgi:uncharacterized protein (TIGR02145 family)/prepilin-type N-terminal cleavage/methylation domain-containing protein
MKNSYTKQPGFTIVELLIVIVVIGILAVISFVAYSGVQRRAVTSVLESDLREAGTQLSLKYVQTNTYPNPSLPSDIKPSGGTSFQYSSDGEAYCLSGFSSRSDIPAHHISNTSAVAEGACPGHIAPGSGVIANGAIIQTVTAANCPTTRTRAVDARDNRTYWVQKLADGKCWMLTNLAYAGGGTNTYTDTKTLQNGTSDTATTYTEPKYYIPSGANATTEPTNPSTSTTGTGQYGYLYNWCAAMGGQTPACQNASGSGFTSASVCPSGWRLPIGDGGEFTALNNAVNSGSTTTNAGLRSTWLAQGSGWWDGGSISGIGYYWSSFQASAWDASYLMFVSNYVSPADNSSKDVGRAVRCVAS